MFIPSKRQSIAFGLIYKGFYGAGFPVPRQESSTVAALVDMKVAHEEPCQIYLYETTVAGVCKYGISKDHELRAKTCKLYERKRYKKYLTSINIDKRSDALIIERLVGDVTCMSEQYWVDHRWKGSERIIEELGNGQEYTRMAANEFNSFVLDVKAQMLGQSRVSFLKSYRPMQSDVATALEWAQKIGSRQLFMLDINGYHELGYGQKSKYGLLYCSEQNTYSIGAMYEWGQYQLKGHRWEVVLQNMGIPIETEPGWISTEW